MLEFLITRIVKLKHCFELINNVVWSFQSRIPRSSPLLAVLLVILLFIPGPLFRLSLEPYHGKLSAPRTRVSRNAGWQGAVISQICNASDMETDRLHSKHAFPIFSATFSPVLPVFRCRSRALGLHLRRCGNAALSSSVKSFATVDMDRKKSHKFITVF